MDDILNFLNETINARGIDYLQRESWTVYQSMRDSGLDDALCRLVLTSLLAGASETARETDVGQLTAFLQETCFLRKDAAKRLASMYKKLFAPDHMADWAQKQESGFREFCERVWEFIWDGTFPWRSGDGHLDCDCSLVGYISVTDPAKARNLVKDILDENPFTTVDGIFKAVSDRLEGFLNHELESFAGGDQLYPPYMEEFERDVPDLIMEFCTDAGLNIRDIVTGSYLSDYIEDHPRRRW